MASARVLRIECGTVEADPVLRHRRERSCRIDDAVPRPRRHARGRSEEYFLCGRPEAFPPGWRFWEEGIFAAPLGAISRADYIAPVHDLGTSANGVFSAKVIWNSMGDVVQRLAEMPEYADLSDIDKFRALFPGLFGMVLSSRRDKVRQAVSWLRAAQDGLWVVSASEPSRPAGDPTYSREAISGMIALAHAAERGWSDLGSALSLEPIHVVYEDLVDPASYADVVRGVLIGLGLGDDRTAIPDPRTIRQSDGLNDEWVEMYENGAENPSRDERIGAGVSDGPGKDRRPVIGDGVDSRRDLCSPSGSRASSSLAGVVDRRTR